MMANWWLLIILLFIHTGYALTKCIECESGPMPVESDSFDEIEFNTQIDILLNPISFKNINKHVLTKIHIINTNGL